ncbi:MAG TPA: hypothetical protein VJ945_04050, partial [Flavobacteriaceae bacterium]|nr:hypothetical protein [Flavobacteriaceae bacterium]
EGTEAEDNDDIRVGREYINTSPTIFQPSKKTQRSKNRSTDHDETLAMDIEGGVEQGGVMEATTTDKKDGEEIATEEINTIDSRHSNDEDVEPDTSDESGPGAAQADLSTKSEPTDATETTRDLLRDERKAPRGMLYLEPGKIKSNWVIIPKSKCSVLFITDSQFARVTEIPDDWEIQAFKGMNIDNFRETLEESNLNQYPHLCHIVVHVGINSRSASFVSNRASLGKTKTSLLKTGLRWSWVGVSIPATLTVAQRSTLTEMNFYLSNNFVGHYIRPIPMDDVCVDPRDIQFRIHYDTDTRTRLFDHILNSFLRLGRLACSQH